MTLSEVKTALQTAENVTFRLPDGSFVPEHFHVTEVGKVSKHFIDCGGTIRTENKANFQLWDANDHEHRLKPGKLQRIIELSEKALGLEDLEIEVEYQHGTIGKFGLAYNGQEFQLTNTHTACLASDSCGSPANKQKISLIELGKQPQAACCVTGKSC